MVFSPLEASEGLGLRGHQDGSKGEKGSRLYVGHFDILEGVLLECKECSAVCRWAYLWLDVSVENSTLFIYDVFRFQISQ